MKKVIFILMLIATSFAVKAQTNGTAYLFPTVAGDTLSTSNGFDSVNKVIPATAGYSALGVHVAVKVLSGSLVGKAYLFQSLNGIDYILTDSASYVSPTTFNGVAAWGTKEARFEKATTPSTYYMVSAAQNTGTVSAAVRVYYVARKYLTGN